MPALFYYCTVFPIFEITAEKTNSHNYCLRMHKKCYICTHCMPVMFSDILTKLE